MNLGCSSNWFIGKVTFTMNLLGLTVSMMSSTHGSLTHGGEEGWWSSGSPEYRGCRCFADVVLGFSHVLACSCPSLGMWLKSMVAACSSIHQRRIMLRNSSNWDMLCGFGQPTEWCSLEKEMLQVIKLIKLGGHAHPLWSCHAQEDGQKASVLDNKETGHFILNGREMHQSWGRIICSMFRRCATKRSYIIPCRVSESWSESPLQRQNTR